MSGADLLAELLRAPGVRSALLELIGEALGERGPTAEPAREIMTEAQACEWLSVSRPTLLRMGLPHVQVGDHRRYVRADVLEHLRKRAETERST